MGANTDISICSSALNLLGEVAIDSLDEETDAARTCAQLYETVKLSLMTEHDWSFTKTKVKLARLVTAPLSRWRYQFEMPTDRLSDVYALYGSPGSAAPITHYEVQGSKVLADFADLWLDYQRNVPETEMPGYFVRLLQYDCAAEFAMAITEQPTVAELWRTTARGSPSENGRGGYFRVAASVDSKGRPNKRIVSDELILVRQA